MGSLASLVRHVKLCKGAHTVHVYGHLWGAARLCLGSPTHTPAHGWSLNSQRGYQGHVVICSFLRRNCVPRETVSLEDRYVLMLMAEILNDLLTKQSRAQNILKKPVERQTGSDASARSLQLLM